MIQTKGRWSLYDKPYKLQRSKVCQDSDSFKSICQIIQPAVTQWCLTRLNLKPDTSHCCWPIPTAVLVLFCLILTIKWYLITRNGIPESDTLIIATGSFLELWRVFMWHESSNWVGLFKPNETSYAVRPRKNLTENYRSFIIAESQLWLINDTYL